MSFQNQFAPLAASAASANTGSAKHSSSARSSGKTVRQTASRLSMISASKKANATYHAANTSGSPGIQIKVEEEDNFRYLLSGEKASSRPQAASSSKKNIASLPKKTRFGPAPAIPACYLKSSSDRKMAQGSSFAPLAQNGVPKSPKLNLPPRFLTPKSSC